MESNQIHPPQWPLKFLRFFVKKEYLEEIEGDMEEMFIDNVERFSIRKAKRIYTWEIVKLLRPILMQNFEGLEKLNQYAMFKNYFKNVFGLAAAIAFCVFAYAYARWTYSRDQFHKNKEVVFLTTFFANRDGSLQQYGTTPRPLAEMLKQDFAQVKKTCRIEDRNAIIKYEDNVFSERIRYTDPEFLDMFTFPLKWGASKSLVDVNSIILSEKMSIKYFGDENPVGQSILVKFDKEHTKAFKVTGVAQTFPVNKSIDFSFLINYENLRASEPGYDFHDWNAFVNATLIQVEKASDIKSIEGGMEKYKKLQNKAVQKEEWAISSFAFEPLATLHERTDNIRDDISREGTSDNKKSIVFLSIVCVLMLTLACFNYINIAIVSAVKRLKEIGVRKSIGATQRVVIVQFLTENIVVTFFALIIGLLLGWTVIIPWFEQLWSFSMGFKLTDPNLWIYLPVILLITGIASGIYPAFYVSSFQAVSIMKGSVKFGNRNPLTKIFLGAQLVLACVFITSAVMFTQNSNYLAHRSWGYSQRDMLFAVVPDQLSYEELSAVMARNLNVVSMAGSSHHVGKNNATTVLHFGDREIEVDQLSVDANYFQTLGILMKEGRAFNDQEGSDKHSVVVNETFVKNRVWEKPIGQQFKIDSTLYEVIGVVKDFHSYDLSNEIRPILFKVADKNAYRFLAIKVKHGTERDTYKAMQLSWAKLFPQEPFNGGFQEDIWGGYYDEIEIHGHVWRVFASVAVILATLGLYGLVTLNVSGRVKEFSIRKVLGAELKNVAANITSQYAVLFSVALIIGVPLSYVSIKSVIEYVYKYHMLVTFTSTALASFLLVFVLLATVSTQIWKVAKANPVEGLKME